MKSEGADTLSEEAMSPSTRRVWIEIGDSTPLEKDLQRVTLHAEGVD